MNVETVTVVKDMAITVPEFFRLLPRALDGHAYVVDHHTVSMGTVSRKVTITIEPAIPRCIAMIVIKRCLVTMTFTGYGAIDRAIFLSRFDNTFRKGGG